MRQENHIYLKEIPESQTQLGLSSAISRGFFIWSSLVLGLMYLVFLNPHLDVRGFNAHDPAGYISRAISLWNGRGYGERFANAFLPVTAQPPMLSLLLAPVVGFFGVNFVVLKLSMLLFAAGLGVLLYRFFKYFFSTTEQALLATLITMASPTIFGLSHRVLADVPLFVFVVLALFTLDRYLREPVPVLSRWLFVSAIASSVAYLIKQTGLAVFFGGWLLVFHPQFRNRRVLGKLVLYSLLGFIPIILWHVWCATVPDDLWYWTTPATRDYLWKNPFTIKDGYLTVSDMITRMRHNIVWGISNNISAVLFSPFYFTEGSALSFLASLPISLWIGWQWGKSLLRSPSVLEGFVFFSLVLLVPKFMGFAARYLALIYPAVLVYAMRGLSGFQKRFQINVLLLLFLISLGTTFAVAVDQSKNPYGSETLGDYVSLAEKAKELF